MPQPSSSIVEEASKKPFWKRKFPGEESQWVRRGVIFQRTEEYEI